MILTRSFVRHYFHKEYVSKVVGLSMGFGNFVSVPDAIKSNLEMAEEDQVSSLCYSVHCMNGKKTSKAKWFGRFADANRKPVELDEDWVAENFSNEYLHKVMTEAVPTQRFLPVPVGLVNNNKEDPRIVAMPDAPVVQYPQGNNDYCVSHSLASCWHHYQADRKHLGHNISQLQAHVQDLDHFKKKLKCLLKDHEIVDIKENEFDPLKEHTDYPVLCVIRGDDGSVNHAVTFLRGWLYDANLALAQPVSQSILDWCCASKYVGVFKGFWFVPTSHNIWSNLRCWTDGKGDENRCNIVHACMSNFFLILGKKELADNFENLVHSKQKGFMTRMETTLRHHPRFKKCKVNKMRECHRLCSSGNELHVMVMRSINTYEFTCMVKFRNTVVKFNDPETTMLQDIDWNQYSFVCGRHIQTNQSIQEEDSQSQNDGMDFPVQADGQTVKPHPLQNVMVTDGHTTSWFSGECFLGNDHEKDMDAEKHMAETNFKLMNLKLTDID